jgi:hypothetical protein
MTDTLPSGAQLLKKTALAIAIAAVVLFTIVLPAEYGVDPTGLGQRLGLISLSGGTGAKPSVEPAAKPEAAAKAEPSLSLSDTPTTTTVWKAARAYRTDELSLTLRPDEGAEIKALMQPGERFVFSWVAEGGPVNFDMHGEKPNARSDDFTSYWKGRSASDGHGEFQAPFAGTHGWYWRNRGTTPVTIRVKTSGFYEKMYRPETK